MKTNAPPVTEEDLKLNLDQWAQAFKERPPVMTEFEFHLGKTIMAARENNELWTGNSLIIIASARKHGIRRDMTRLLMRLVAECEVESEGPR